MVARNHNHRDLGSGELAQRLGDEPDRVNRWDRPIKQVTAHHDHINVAVDRDLQQPAAELALGRQQVLAVEGPTQMPVGGMKNEHAMTLAVTTDSPGP